MTRRRDLATLLFVLAPGSASAQVPVYPNQPEAPITLDPAKSGNQLPQQPQQQQPQQPAKPNVVIVGPDGKIIGGDAQPAAPGGYYVPSGGDQTYQEPSVIHSGPVPELHVVRRGDTLWDICWYYFNDPWQWPKVWSYNPQITNPHWIYPGDLVRLLPRGTFEQQPGLDPEAGTGDKTQGQGTTGARDQVPPPQRRIESAVTTTAFVEKSDLDKSITIDGAVDEKTLLGAGDEVYLSYPKDRPPEPGKRYSIYVAGRSVKHNGKEYGSYVRLLGSLEVLSVKQDKRARGRIIEANMEIERGSKVGPLVTKFKNVPPVPPKVDLQGAIVAMLTKDQLIGDRGEVVFVALGKSSGLVVGNRMYVVRRGDAMPNTMSENVGSDDRRFPARALGEIVIVEVGDKISIGVVTLSVQEMSVGDLVMMQKAK
ncbi:MAG TPA: LysM peptidoglycan-binding domain-containing protein [Kofleriaceae bacterium]|nr:LysM peptidoglycan-binding domain-containing protein [Kofleriaceae bacterium]